MGIGGVVSQHPGEEHVGQGGQSHGRSLVAGAGLVYAVQSQGSDHIDPLAFQGDVEGGLDGESHGLAFHLPELRVALTALNVRRQSTGTRCRGWRTVPYLTTST